MIMAPGNSTTIYIGCHKIVYTSCVKDVGEGSYHAHCDGKNLKIHHDDIFLAEIPLSKLKPGESVFIDDFPVKQQNRVFRFNQDAEYYRGLLGCMKPANVDGQEYSVFVAANEQHAGEATRRTLELPITDTQLIDPEKGVTEVKDPPRDNAIIVVGRRDGRSEIYKVEHYSLRPATEKDESGDIVAIDGFYSLQLFLRRISPDPETNPQVYLADFNATKNNGNISFFLTMQDGIVVRISGVYQDEEYPVTMAYPAGYGKTARPKK